MHSARDFRHVRPRATDRVLIAGIEEHLRNSYGRLGIDPVRFRWRIRVRAYPDTARRDIEVTIPCHPADRTQVLATRSTYRIVSGEVHPALRLVGVDEVLAKLQRHVIRESRLAAAGHDPFSPPAETFLTDLIFRRALEHRGVDRDALVVRGTGAFSTPSPGADRGEVHRLAPRCLVGWTSVPKPALPVDFFHCVAEFDVDRLFLWSLSLSHGVQVRADPHEGEADVDLRIVLPDTMLIGLVGRHLREVVGHPVFDDDRLVILNAVEDFGWTTLRVTNPVVALA